MRRRSTISKWWRVPGVLIVSMLVFCTLLLMTHMDMLQRDTAFSVAANYVAMMVSLLMYSSALRCSGILPGNRLLLLIIFFQTAYSFADLVFWFADGHPNLWRWNVAINWLYLLMPLAMSLCFWFFFLLWLGAEAKDYSTLNGVLIGEAVGVLLLLLTNSFTGFLFSVDPVSGLYRRGPLSGISMFFLLGMVLGCVYVIRQLSVSKRDAIVFISYLLFPGGVALLQLAIPQVSYLSLGSFLSVVFLFTNIFLYHETELDVRRRELQQIHLNLLQMQINPHFLYNTLASISSLCDTDPEQAQEMIFLLSDYLHGNFSDITKPTVITLEEELRHLERYVAIEKMRFPDIQVVYDLQCQDIRLPAMTLQPLVENAIKHGLRRKKGEGGTITISTAIEGDERVLRVQDDGVGLSEPSKYHRKKGIGLANVQERLRVLCEGTLRLYPAQPQGTICEIRLPGTTYPAWMDEEVMESESFEF